MIVFGVSCSAMSIAYGKVVKVVHRFIILLFGGALVIGVIIFIGTWDRVPSYAFIFTFAVVWGIANAIWITTATSKSRVICILYMRRYMYSGINLPISKGLRIKDTSVIRTVGTGPRFRFLHRAAYKFTK